MPIQDIDVTTYYAPITNTEDPYTKIIDFPAQAQKYEGVYQLILIAKIADPGYKDFQRTVTINNNNIFELVGDSEEEGVDNPVQIEIVDQSSTEPLQDVYVIAGGYSDKTVHLRRNDNSVIDVDVSPITSWYEGD